MNNLYAEQHVPAKMNKAQKNYSLEIKLEKQCHTCLGFGGKLSVAYLSLLPILCQGLVLNHNTLAGHAII